jgi:hypothetical protein
MAERLLVEVVRADEVREGDRVFEPLLGQFVSIENVEQGDPVEWLRWKAEGWCSPYMRPGGHVLRVVRAPAESSFRIFTCAHSHRFAVGSREDLRSLRCAICGTTTVEPVPS